MANEKIPLTFTQQVLLLKNDKHISIPDEAYAKRLQKQLRN